MSDTAYESPAIETITPDVPDESEQIIVGIAIVAAVAVGTWVFAAYRAYRAQGADGQLEMRTLPGTTRR